LHLQAKEKLSSRKQLGNVQLWGGHGTWTWNRWRQGDLPGDEIAGQMQTTEMTMECGWRNGKIQEGKNTIEQDWIKGGWEKS
jgi:hypothetical protein